MLLVVSSYGTPVGTASTAGFTWHREFDGAVFTHTRAGYGMLRYGYSVQKPDPWVTHAEPYQQLVVTWSIPWPISLHNARAFSDVSSGIAIAIVIREHWRAWHLIPGWKILNSSKDIGWAEAIGFELLPRALIMQSPNPLSSSSMGTTLVSLKDGGIGGTKSWSQHGL